MVQSRKVRSFDASDRADFKAVEVELAYPGGGHGYLLYGEFDRRGRPLDPPGEPIAWLSTRIRQRLSNQRSRLGPRDHVYQFQVFVSDESFISAQRRREAQAVFTHSHAAILGALFEQ